MYKSKAELNSVSMHLQQNLATYKLAGAIKKSADVMRMMNNLIKLPQLNQTMMVMAREMEKAGLIEEMIDGAHADAKIFFLIFKYSCFCFL
jgi:charged multivesicular body protein 3